MQAQAAAHSPLQTYTISAFFQSEKVVEEVIKELVNQGIPRDLIDVVVSKKAMQRFFGGRARPYRDSIFSFAGRGALSGLIISAIISLAITLIPNYQPSGTMAHVQLAGPNVGTILGATLGALYGLVRKPRPKPQHYRALERDDALLLLVHLQRTASAEHLALMLHQRGAIDPRLELDSPEAVGAE